MIRILSFLIVIASATLTIWMVMKNDGQIVIEWLDYYIETSFIFAVLLIFFCLLLSTILFNFIGYLSKLPTEFSGKLNEIKKKKLLLNLVDGFIAFESGDFDKAKAISKKLLPLDSNDFYEIITPIQNIFASKFIGVGDEKIYVDALENKKLHFWALKNIFASKFDQKKYSEALHYGEEAHKINPKIFAINKMLLDTYLNLAMWDKAINIINDLDDNSILDLAPYVKELFFIRAKEFEESENLASNLQILEKLAKKLPDDADVILHLAKIYGKIEDNKLALKFLEKSWKLAPSEEAAKLLLDIHRAEKIPTIIDKFNLLLSTNENNISAYLVLAEFLLTQNKLDEAKKIMLDLLTNHKPTAEIAKIMLKLEFKYSPSSSEIEKWLEKL